tara:strand:+ start:25365 stop:25574 length:210 start_codon:yes stop_codon:yes gene_type:complete
MKLGNEVHLERRFNYGTYRYWPKNSLAILLCQLAKTKTLSEDQQKLVEKMGFEMKGGSNNLLDKIREQF